MNLEQISLLNMVTGLVGTNEMCDSDKYRLQGGFQAFRYPPI